MQALTVRPGAAGSARLEQLPEPSAEPGPVLVEALASDDVKVVVDFVR
jgi:hypothetical protein